MDTPNLTILEYALLGLVSFQPMSGYDVHRLFETTPMAHFSSSPGAIYPALKRLAERDLLAASLDAVVRTRPRRVFTLTGAGTAVLDAWLRAPVTREEIIRTPGASLLRFSFMEGRLPAAEIRAYLDGYSAVVSAYVTELEEYVRQAAPTLSLHGRLCLEHGVEGNRQTADWIRRAMQALAAGAPTGAPAVNQQ